MLFVGTLFAIPKVEQVFEEVGTSSTLPEITIWFQGVVKAMLTYWPVPTAIIVIAIVSVIAYIQTPKGRYRFDYFKLRPRYESRSFFFD